MDLKLTTLVLSREVIDGKPARSLMASPPQFKMRTGLALIDYRAGPRGCRETDDQHVDPCQRRYLLEGLFPLVLVVWGISTQFHFSMSLIAVEHLVATVFFARSPPKCFKGVDCVELVRGSIVDLYLKRQPIAAKNKYLIRLISVKRLSLGHGARP